LTRFDTGHLLGVLDAVSERAEVEGGPRWLTRLADSTGEMLRELWAVGCTVIHGSFYRSALLARDDRIYPVDWETAAIAPGEIDVATLLDGWPSAIAAHVWATYSAHRMGTDEPQSRWRRDVANVYVQAQRLHRSRKPIASHERRLKSLRGSIEQLHDH
jgi:thiamine kinase-like enzyme